MCSSASSRCARASSTSPPPADLGQRERRGRGGDQGGVAELARAPRARPCPSPTACSKSSRYMPSRPSSICSAAASGVSWSGKLLPGRVEAAVRFVVAALPVLDGGTERGQLDSPRDRIGLEQVDRLEQRRRGSGRARRSSAGPRQAPRAPPPGARCRRWEAAAGRPRTSAPPRRAHAPRPRAPGGQQDLDRLLVALGGGLLHVVRALGRRSRRARRARPPRARAPPGASRRASTRTPRAARAGGGR